MNNNILKPDRFGHIAIIVKNLEETLDTYCKLLNMDRPLVKMTGEPQAAKVMYRGNSTPARAKQAFLQLGPLRVEFLEPDNNPSIWREFLDNNGEGIHHISVVVDDMEEALAEFSKNQMSLIQSGEYNGGQYAYLDSIGQFKYVIELLKNY